MKYKMASQLLKNDIVRNVATLLAGSGSAQLLALLASPLITRLYTPAEFGALGVFVAIVTILISMMTMGYDLAIPIADDDVSAMNLLLVCGYFIAVIFCLLSIAVWWYGGWIERVFGMEILGSDLWLLPVSLLGAGIIKALTAWAIRKKDYKPISKSKIIQALGQLAMQLGLGLFHMGRLGLLISDVVGRGGGAWTFLKRIVEIDIYLLHKTGRRQCFSVIGRYKRFAYISVPSAMFHTAGSVLPTVMLASMYGASVAGWYAFCQRIIWGPLSLVGGSLAQVFFAEAAVEAKKDPKKLKRMMIKTSKILALASGMPLVLVMIFGAKLFPLIFGHSWTMAGIYAQILSATYIVQFFVGPVFQVLNVLERQSWLFACDILGVALVALSIYLCHENNYSSVAAISFYSVAVIIMYVSLLVAAFKAVDAQISNNLLIAE